MKLTLLVEDKHSAEIRITPSDNTIGREEEQRITAISGKMSLSLQDLPNLSCLTHRRI
ncbi:MAG: hypothetical protein WCS58_05485 [Candidatus Cloacimonadaceae bacterium]|nr:hypothetical protein [Candidatus Cloacimonadota bacterium]